MRMGFARRAGPPRSASLGRPGASRLPRATGRAARGALKKSSPYARKFGRGPSCAAHRLPENHDCQGLDAYKDRVRAEGRVFAPPQEARVTPRVATTARAG